MISKKGSGGLPIRSGDTDHTGVGKSPANSISDTTGMPLANILATIGRRGYSGTLDHHIGIKYLIFSMLSLFVWDRIAIKHCFIFG